MRERYFNRTKVRWPVRITLPLLMCVSFLAVERASATIAAQYEGLWINDATKECSLVSVNEMTDGPFGTITGRTGFQEYAIVTSQPDINGPFIMTYQTPYGSCTINDPLLAACCSDLGLKSVSRDAAVNIQPAKAIDNAVSAATVRTRDIVAASALIVTAAAVVTGWIIRKRRAARP